MAELIQIAVEKVDHSGAIVKRTLVGFKEIKKGGVYDECPIC